MVDGWDNCAWCHQPFTDDEPVARNRDDWPKSYHPECQETKYRTAKSGFYDKFAVTRMDGRPIKEQTRYFVLDYGTDQWAREAIMAYAKACKQDNPTLARDILDKLEETRELPA